MNVTIENIDHLSDDQADFVYDDTTPHLFFLGGYGSGKTFCLCLKAVLLAFTWGDIGRTQKKKLRGMIVSPTFPSFKGDVLPSIRDEVLGSMRVGGDTMWDLCDWHGSDRVLTFPNGFQIVFKSGDKPYSLRGPNMAFVGANEMTTFERLDEAFHGMTSRLRAGPTIDGKMRTQFFGNGTPEQVDLVHEKFVRGPDDSKEREAWSKMFRVINSASWKNPLHEGGKDSQFVKVQKAGMPEAMWASLIEGHYVDFSRGKCYFAFSEDNVAELAYSPKRPLMTSWDFNLDPMVMTIHQRHGTKLETIDEVAIRNSNTPEVCQEFIKRYGPDGLDHQGDLYVYGDASGGTATAGWTDFDEIVSSLRQAFWGKVFLRVGDSNPRHTERLVSVNNKLRPGVGDPTWSIDKGCKYLLRDLRYQNRTSDNRKEKNQAMDGEILGHASDTADYVIHYEWPFKRQKARDAVALSNVVRPVVTYE